MDSLLPLQLAEHIVALFIPCNIWDISRKYVTFFGTRVIVLVPFFNVGR